MAEKIDAIKEELTATPTEALEAFVEKYASDSRTGVQKLVDAGILVVSFAREHNSLESLFFHLTGETEQKSRNTETFGNTIG